MANLIADLEDRGFAFDSYMKIENALIDAPGPVFIGRPFEDIVFDGIKIQVPCEDFAFVEEKFLEALPRKFFNGDTYFKIHTWNNCFVFNEAQRNLILEELDIRWERASQEGADFLDECISKMRTE